MHAENVALRTAMDEVKPLIWFMAAAPAAYLAVYPIWIVSDEPNLLQFAIAFDMAQTFVPVGAFVDERTRRYVQSITRRRLHQPLFRARVLGAYGNRCAMCRLGHATLLDAAHILPDGHPLGTPIIPNGLSLCKIHHAAYDQNFLGVRPDLEVVVRQDVMGEIDGPMLLHGLQGMKGQRLSVPTSRSARPDPDRLEERYSLFIKAG